MLRILLLIGSMVFAFSATAQQRQDIVKVLVFKSGTKPSEAIKNPEYEFRVVQGRDAELLCDLCRLKPFPEAPDNSGHLLLVSTPRNTGIAYLCLDCKELVWRDAGKELVFKQDSELKALEKIKRELQAKIKYTEIAR